MPNPEVLFEIALTVAAMLVPADLWWVRGLLWLLVVVIAFHLTAVAWKPHLDTQTKTIGAWVGSLLFLVFLGWQSTWIPLQAKLHPITVSPTSVQFDAVAGQVFTFVVQNTNNRDSFQAVAVLLTATPNDVPKTDFRIDFPKSEWRPLLETDPSGSGMGDIEGVGCQDFEANPTFLLIINRLDAGERRHISVFGMNKKAATMIATVIKYQTSAAMFVKGSTVSTPQFIPPFLAACNMIITNGVKPQG